MQIIKYICLKNLKHHWESSLLLGPMLTLSQTELQKISFSSYKMIHVLQVLQ